MVLGSEQLVRLLIGNSTNHAQEARLLALGYASIVQTVILSVSALKLQGNPACLLGSSPSVDKQRTESPASQEAHASWQLSLRG